MFLVFCGCGTTGRPARDVTVEMRERRLADVDRVYEARLAKAYEIFEREVGALDALAAQPGITPERNLQLKQAKLKWSEWLVATDETYRSRRDEEKWALLDGFSREDREDADRVHRRQLRRAEQMRPLGAGQLSAVARGCSSNVECGVGFACVKRMYASAGECARVVDEIGAPVYDIPAASYGPKSPAADDCRFDTECPAGFRCDVASGACMRGRS